MTPQAPATQGPPASGRGLERTAAVPGESSAWTEDEFAEAVDGLAPVALRAAAALRIADHIVFGAEELTKLAQRVGADPGMLGRLMRFLACRGVFREVSPGVFGLTRLSLCLLDGHRSRLRAWLDPAGVGGRMDRAVGSLLEAVRSGRPSYPELFGTDFYSDLTGAGGSTPSFDELRGAHASEFAAEIAAALERDRVSSVVDVGGGTGVVIEALLRAHPRMLGYLVDLPAAVSAATDRLTVGGLAERFVPRAGSFFDPLPAGADAYLLVNVLHNWDDEPATRILRRCAEAARPSSEVLVVERFTDRTDPRAATAMDIRMFLFCGGRERSLEELRSLATAAGLTISGGCPLPSGLEIVHMKPASNNG